MAGATTVPLLVALPLLLPALGSSAPIPAHVLTASTTSGSCSGYSSNTVPPDTIRVLVHNPAANPNGAIVGVQTVGFETYVENVLPNEWYPAWNAEALKAGAEAAKMYAWYWVIHWRGGTYTDPTTNQTQCYDVDDTTNYQVYKANTAVASTNAAVQATWYTEPVENGQVFEASYCSNMNCGYYTPTNPNAPNGSQDLCGTDPSGNPNTNGYEMSQYGSEACAQNGLNYQQILGVYYYVTRSNPELSFVTTTPPLPRLAAFQANNGQLWTMGSLGWKNWGVGMAPGTSPAFTMLPNGYELAFQAYGGQLWSAGNAGWVNWGVGVAPGTSPSVIALPKGGYEIAFQGYSGQLWTVGNAGWKDWGVGMAPGTSPSMIALPNGGYEIAFQAYGGGLWTVGTAGWTSWGVGMAANTSPAAIALPQGGFQVAFQAYGGPNGGDVWTVGNAGWTDWGPAMGNVGMAPGTSPSLVALPKGGFEVALQANGGDLWTVGTTGTTDWGLAMAPNSSPGITVQSDGTLLEAYNGSDGGLWTVSSGGYEWPLGMASSTSPAVR